MVKSRLVMTFTADDGGRKSVFTLNETGDRLTLSVTITSSASPTRSSTRSVTSATESITRAI